VRKYRRALIVAAALALLLYVGIEIDLAGRGTPPLPPSSAPLILRGGMVRGTNHTIKTRSWSFTYDHGQLSPDGTAGTLDGVRDGIVYRKGKPYLRIDARHVSVNALTLDFTAIGLVHVQMLQDRYHRSFDTDDVAWTNNAKLLQMPHTSYLHVGGQTLRIGSITVNFSTNEVHLHGIQGTVGIQ
jgi:hypothetical protein